jgi:hypothetical protein
MTGIGFLGAGVIFKEGLTVRGLTTAASIWITASIGILVGIGFYFPAAVGTVAALTVLAAFRYVECGCRPSFLPTTPSNLHAKQLFRKMSFASSLAVTALPSPMVDQIGAVRDQPTGGGEILECKDRWQPILEHQRHDLSVIGRGEGVGWNDQAAA